MFVSKFYRFDHNFGRKLFEEVYFWLKCFVYFFYNEQFSLNFFLFRSELVSKNGFFDTSQNVPVNVNMVSIQNDLSLSLIMFMTPWPPSHHQPSISQPQCGTMTTTIQFFQTEDHNKFRKNNLKKDIFRRHFLYLLYLKTIKNNKNSLNLKTCFKNIQFQSKIFKFGRKFSQNIGLNFSLIENDILIENVRFYLKKMIVLSQKCSFSDKKMFISSKKCSFWVKNFRF